MGTTWLNSVKNYMNHGKIVGATRYEVNGAFAELAREID
jgi:hypothetical protein